MFTPNFIFVTPSNTVERLEGIWDYCQYLNAGDFLEVDPLVKSLHPFFQNAAFNAIISHFPSGITFEVTQITWGNHTVSYHLKNLEESEVGNAIKRKMQD
jgi:hypothetical protein